MRAVLSSAQLLLKPLTAEQSLTSPSQADVAVIQKLVVFRDSYIHGAINNPPSIHCVSLTDAWSLLYFDAQPNVHVSV